MTASPGARAVGARLDRRPPFHLEATVRVLQRRPGNLVDVWSDDRTLGGSLIGKGLIHAPRPELVAR